MAERLSSVPRKSGVYIFRGAGEKVLYVGKAKDLRARLVSYFRKSADLDARKAAMVRGVTDFSFIVTDNELEALALEANLIKQYRPRFNVVLRDDKNYPYLRLTLGEEWPRLEVVRRTARDGAAYFGPYVPTGGMREVLAVIRRNFGLRPCRYRLDKPMRPCVQHQMGRCLAPCAGLVGREEYMRAVNEAVMFLKGRRTELLRELEEEMQRLSEDLRYEEAAGVRDRIGLLRKAWESQKVISPELGDMDVLGLFQRGGDAALQVFFIRGGVMVGGRDFYLRGVGDMPVGEFLNSFILNFYSGEVTPPGEVVAAALPDDEVNLAEWLNLRRGGRVRLTVPMRGKKLALLRLAVKNARHAREAGKDPAGAIALEELRVRLGLEVLPRTIGGFDVSTLTGGESVGAFVFWEEGEFRKDLYRRLKIRDTTGVDDYAMMKESIRRGLADMETMGLVPDLVVVDGGRGHLETALSAVDILREPPEVVAVAKKPDRAFSRLLMGSLDLEDGSRSSLLLRRIRDEAHRFAIGFHKRLRGRRLMESPLESVPGIGKKRRLALLRHFGSLEAIRKAGIEEIASAPGMNRKTARAVREVLGAS